MMQGIYRVYKDGKLILEKENQITVAGRAIILKAIMGLIPSIGGNIQVGISSVANQDADPTNGLIPDTRLGFSVGSIPVRLAFLDNSGNYDAMVFRGTIPSNADAFKIYELGIFPTNPNQSLTPSQSTLASGQSTDNWSRAGSQLNAVSGNPPATSGYVSSAPTGFTGGFRVGSTALFLKQDQTLRIDSNFNNQFTTSGPNAFSPNDNISIAYSKKTGDAPKITLKFFYNNSNYYTANFTDSSSGTYAIKDILQSSFTAFGDITDWGSIRGIEIMAENSDVIIDAIRINDNFNTDTTFGMVSRTVLGEEQVITKGVAESIDIEYYLSFGFNKVG
jgi:hypothetical protein